LVKLNFSFSLFLWKESFSFFCDCAHVVALNLMRLSGTIKAKRTEEGAWVWWVEDKEEDVSIKS